MKVNIINGLIIACAYSILAIILALLFSPWHVTPDQSSISFLFYLVSGLGIVLFIYLLFRYRITLKQHPIFKILLILSLLASILSYGRLIYPKGRESTYLLLYTRKGHPSETIKIIHHHFALYNWNTIEYLIEYPKFGFRFERSFHRKDLDGQWIVHKDNPFHPKEGIYTFRNGVIISE